MKNITLMAVAMVAALFIQTSCTKIDAPYYTIKSIQVDTNNRTVLIEDYTGHQCVNCAPAASTAAAIADQYNGQVMVIAVHAGFFSTPSNKYSPYLLGDYRSETGNDWNDHPPFNIYQNPLGMVSRRPYNGNISFLHTDWSGAVEQVAALPKIAYISVGPVYNAENKTLTATVGVKFISDYPGAVKMTVCLLEDDIYGGQLNNIPPDSTPIIKNYRFMHVLRGSMNGSFGEQISTGPKNGDTFSKSFTMDFNGKEWVPEHCAVIAFISDAATEEVLHVGKAHLAE